MSTHTPGPWSIEDRRRRGGALQVQAQHRGEGSSYCVASVNHWESADENARLIAQSPALLDLAKQYASECAECNGSGERKDGNHGGDPRAEACTVPCDECNDIRAVIDAAEGR